MVDLLDCSSMATACTTIPLVQICQASCRHHSSLDTWHAYATVSFLCLGLLVSVQHSFLCVIYTDQSSASSRWSSFLPIFIIHVFVRAVLGQRGLFRIFVPMPELVIHC